MTLAGFVQSAGSAMGYARDAFGLGGSPALSPAGLGGQPGQPMGAGRAAEGSGLDAEQVAGHVAALGEHDRAGVGQVLEVGAMSAAGRSRMESIIVGAVADVATLGMSADTPEGQRRLVEAIKRRLQDTRGTLDRAGSEAGTAAAAARGTTAGYNGVSPGPAMTGPMPGGMGAPIGGGGMPGLGSLAGAAPQLASLLGGPMRSAQTPVATGPAVASDEPASAVAMPTPPVRDDPRSVARYIYQAALARGYSPHDSLAIAGYAKGESGFDPTISGGPQGGDGYEDTVIGNFQEKPGFARAVGMDPALRYTVEGNTEIYLRHLAQNPDGDIFDRLLATSVGGPMYTGGRGYCRRLMAETRTLLGGDV